MELKPKIIESKGDTLFAANISYTQDDVDKEFEGYDTRSFSTGNYWKLRNPEQGQLPNVRIDFENRDNAEKPGGTLVDLGEHGSNTADLCHYQFTDATDYTWNANYWHP